MAEKLHPTQFAIEILKGEGSPFFYVPSIGFIVGYEERLLTETVGEHANPFSIIAK